MTAEIDNIIGKLAALIAEENTELVALGGGEVGFAEIVLLGQFSLLSNEATASRLRLALTHDVDAWVRGDRTVTSLFKRVLDEIGYRFDDLSQEIWLPDGAQFELIHEAKHFAIKRVDPVSALISKAIKAPEKNRILVRDALKVYGEVLAVGISVHGGDLEFFEYEA